MNKKKTLLGCITVAVILITAFVFRLPGMPHFSGISADSGLFAYGGQQLLAGGKLYVDIWDTKPPLVFLINAVGQLFLGQTAWSLWWQVYIWTAGAAVLFFYLLKRVFGWLPAVLGTWVWFAAYHEPVYYQGGNYTENYALIPQLAAFLFLFMYMQEGKKKWIIYTGMVTAIAVLSKPTYFSAGMASMAGIAWYALRRSGWRQLLATAIWFATGLVIPLALTALYFVSQDTLSDFWYAVIVYDVIYVRSGLHLGGLKNTFWLVRSQGPLSIMLVPVVLTAALTGVMEIINTVKTGKRSASLSKWKATESEQLVVFMLAVLISLPVEFLMAAISGRNYGHYFLMLIPAVSICVTFLFWLIQRGITQIPVSTKLHTALTSLVIILVVAFSYKEWPDSFPKWIQVQAFTEKGFSLGADPFTERIEKYTETSDSVLLWSIHPSINYLSGRRSPASIVFATQYVLPGVDNTELFQTLFEELEQDPPKLILTQTQSGLNLAFLGDTEESILASVPEGSREGMRELKRYFDSYYEPLEQYGEWWFYGRVE